MRKIQVHSRINKKTSNHLKKSLKTSNNETSFSYMFSTIINQYHLQDWIRFGLTAAEIFDCYCKNGPVQGRMNSQSLEDGQFQVLTGKMNSSRCWTGNYQGIVRSLEVEQFWREKFLHQYLEYILKKV